ncbi:MAG: HDOD domain-containing protein [Dehalococcoidia bacterium]|jgi:putative nucleotidyltransferase with HDIG domain|uniref:HDOD domain-containing protein n=1 Tax=Candidatus Amarobacter glycogenicus TaxID=3140699 RepID=UPI001D6EA138|nr:HDOD domain-containing protein [Dehalococcoidia bacterium]MBK6561480.1 HDOD domain-containing protein [Dehalococcoidia bacterium]MBK7127324.1 HDOD domain-containing protein [Dehalococcoidia bacterium]MBK7327729.1 HDOD domain-containing protein [Dehalococcoidia bacterium]MBK7726331.1 HDOD domain-containing protein [Dehalococcoidia bacterium]
MPTNPQQPASRASSILSAIEALPPLPAVALRVMEVAQNPKSSASDLALVVSSDPGLSGRLLRVVNSAAYRRAREVTSVQEALVTLGFVQARNMAISGAIAGAYAPDALNALFRIEVFWRHSIAVAFKAAELAGKSRRLDVPTAFTAGILHNMGRLAMFYADATALDQAIAACLARGETLEALEGELLGYDHAEVGGLLAKRWNLPADIQEAVARHHSAEPDDVTLAAVVSVADRFVTANGLQAGYIIPPAYGELRVPTPDFLQLSKQVDSLMELVKGSPAGVAA